MSLRPHIHRESAKSQPEQVPARDGPIGKVPHVPGGILQHTGCDHSHVIARRWNPLHKGRRHVELFDELFEGCAVKAPHLINLFRLHVCRPLGILEDGIMEGRGRSGHPLVCLIGSAASQVHRYAA